MFNNDHRVPQFHQLGQDVQQLPYIIKMQARGRLVQQIERPSRIGSAQLLGEFDALGLPSREGRRGLTQPPTVIAR